MSVCDEETEGLDNAVEPAALEKIVSRTTKSFLKPPLDGQHIHRIVGVYHLLLFCPTDYLGRPQRVKFSRRALEADVAASILWPSTEERLRCTLTFRSFALRTAALGGSTDHQVRA